MLWCSAEREYNLLCMGFALVMTQWEIPLQFKPYQHRLCSTYFVMVLWDFIFTGMDPYEVSEGICPGLCITPALCPKCRQDKVSGPPQIMLGNMYDSSLCGPILDYSGMCIELLWGDSSELLVSTGIFERSCLEPPSGVVGATALVRVEAGAEV